MKMNFKQILRESMIGFSRRERLSRDWILFIYDLFNNAIVSSDAMTSYVRMIIVE
jgi:hypothetical protein